MKKNEPCGEPFMVDCLSWDSITKAANILTTKPIQKLHKVYKDIPIEDEKLQELSILLFTIEALILSEGMRDSRLSKLDQSALESLAFELFLKIEITRSQHGGCGYLEMGTTADNVITERLQTFDLQDIEMQGGNL